MKTKFIMTVFLFTIINVGFNFIITDIPSLFPSFSFNMTEFKIVSVTLIGGFHILYILWNICYNVLAYVLLINNESFNKYFCFLYQVSYIICLILSYLAVPLNSYVCIIYAFLGTITAFFVISSAKRDNKNDKNQRLIRHF